MRDSQLTTPVAFIIFNRPKSTEQVFAAIARARPKQLFVIADGPRPGRTGEQQLCLQTREIIERVDWPCEVQTHYAAMNLGCRDRVSSGLDWLFSNVREAIILEDDCLPHPSFFPYCVDLLDRYRHDYRIGMISGDNFQFGRKTGDGSYYFSKYTHIWGWAGWSRAWQNYDVSARIWPEFHASGNFDSMTFPFERTAWRSAFEGVYKARIDTWDYQWTLACWSKSMLTVVPQVNMITNIGFGSDATHTRGESRYANLESQAIEWPLREPKLILPHATADRRTAQEMFRTSLPRRLMQHAVRLAGIR